MSDKSTIEWTDATWNPVRGCEKVSPGCKHCYAETFAERWRGIAGHPYEQGFDPRLMPDKLSEPLHWAKSRTIFVCSMSDLLQDFVPTEYIREVADVIARADWHTYQILTKRAERLAELGGLFDMSHVIAGVTVEDRKYGIPRIDALRRAQVHQRFLSVEPLLEDLGDVDLAGIDWVIVGGESGLGAREMPAAWALRMRDACAEQRVPFFFKQWGGLRKKVAGRTLEGRTYDERPTLEPRSTGLTAKQRRAREREWATHRRLTSARPAAASGGGRLMSFALTEPQLLDGSKDVTRRLGWLSLKKGDRLQAVRKAMGLRRGEKVHRLCSIEVVDVRRERLDAITPDDVRREGFAGMPAVDFIEFFCTANKCRPDTEVTRIEFQRVDQPKSARSKRRRDIKPEKPKRSSRCRCLSDAVQLELGVLAGGAPA